MNEKRDFKTEVELLKAAYPDLEEIPDQVAQAAAQGRSMVEAYGDWKAQENRRAKTLEQLKAENTALKAENERLKRQLNVFKQNAGARERAVGGLQEGGREKARNSGFLAGLESGGW